MKNILLGTWCEIPSSYSINVIAKSNMDFVIIDLEHGVINLETLQNMVFAAQADNMRVFVRVSEKNIGQISPALDTCIDGLMIPHVQNIRDVNQIIDNSMFYPQGNRGFNPFTRVCNYKSVNQEYLQKINTNLTISVIIEDAEGLKNLDEISGHPFIDIIYLGQYDLSVSLGIAGEIDHPLLVSKLNEAVKIINNHNKMAACMIHSIQQAKEAIGLGYKVLLYKVDTNILLEAYSCFKESVLRL